MAREAIRRSQVGAGEIMRTSVTSCARCGHRDFPMKAWGFPA